MNNVLFLVKNYFRMFLTKLLRRQKNSGNSVAIFAMLLSLVFVGSFAFLSYTTIQTALKAGMPSLALSSFATTILMFTFMLVVTESSSTSKHTDEEMLLSLPFTKRQIILTLFFFAQKIRGLYSPLKSLATNLYISARYKAIWDVWIFLYIFVVHRTSYESMETMRSGENMLN